MQTTVIVTTESQLEEIVERVMRRIQQENNQGKPELIYTVNQVAKRLHLSHSTVKNRIQSGMIKTTLDGRIPESAINEYLQKPP